MFEFHLNCMYECLALYKLVLRFYFSLFCQIFCSRWHKWGEGNDIELRNCRFFFFQFVITKFLYMISQVQVDGSRWLYFLANWRRNAIIFVVLSRLFQMTLFPFMTEINQNININWWGQVTKLNFFFLLSSVNDSISISFLTPSLSICIQKKSIAGLTDVFLLFLSFRSCRQQ